MWQGLSANHLFSERYWVCCLLILLPTDSVIVNLSRETVHLWDIRLLSFGYVAPCSCICIVLYSGECSWPSQRGQSSLTLATAVRGKHTAPVTNISLCHWLTFFPLFAFFRYFIVPTGILRPPWLRVFRVSFSVVRQMPVYNSQRRGTASTLPN